MALCEEDIDCDPLGTNRLCYSNLSGFESFVDLKGCACNSFYGWEGENCDEFTFSSYFTVIIMGFAAFLSYFYFVLSVRLFILSWKYEAPYTSKFWTILCLVIGSFGNGTWALAHFLSVSTTSGDAFLVNPEDYRDFFFGRFFIFTSVGVFGFLSTYTAVIAVAIVWLDTSKTTRNLNKDQSSSYIVNRRLLIGMIVLSVVQMIVGFTYERAVNDGSSITGFLFVFSTAWTVAWFILAYARFMPILKTASALNGNKMVESTREIVHITTRRIIVGLLLLFISEFTFSCMDTFGGTWKNFSQVGKVSEVKFVHHLGPTALLILIFSVYRYLLVLSTNGGMYMIVGICTPEMVEDPGYFPDIDSKDNDVKKVSVIDIAESDAAEPSSANMPPGNTVLADDDTSMSL